MSRALLGVAILAAIACMPSSTHETEVAPAHADASAPAEVAAAPAAQAQLESAKTAAAPVEVVDSTMPARKRIVAPKASSGLVAFAEQMAPGGLVWVGPLAGNGGRDVLVYVPPGAKNDRDVRLVFHFHGTYSEHIEAKAPGLEKKRWVGWDRVQQTIEAIDELQSKRDYNVALVYPLSAGKRREPGITGWFNKDYDRMWMQPAPPEYTDSFDVLYDETIAILRDRFGVHPSRLRAPAIAEGHSAGGIALFNIATVGTTHVGEYIFLDASFQGWADGCWQAVQSAKSAALVTLVVTQNGIADPFGAHDPWCVRLESEAAWWGEHARQCTSPAKKPGPKFKTRARTCEELEESARDWETWRDWCEATERGLQGMPGLYLHTTKIPHGKQPRHFAGGLELPPERGG